MDGSMSPADMRAVLDGRDGYGDGFGMGGGWFAWILLFALFGGNGFGFGGRGQAATTEDLASGFNFNSLQSKTNDILAAVNGVNQNLGNAICTSTYELAGKISGVEAAMQACCCDLARSIDGVNYNGAMNTAAINANTTAGVQKILDAITGNRMADMQSQINQLQLQAALCGIPRTNPYGYGIYAYPACSGFTGCNTCTNI